MPSIFTYRNCVWLALALPILASCGKVENADRGPTEAGISMAGTAASGVAGSAGSASVAGSAGTNGVAGAGQEAPIAPADVAGRWGMFVFEDPVGVRLYQNGESLEGEGCAAGAPPLDEGGLAIFCGPIFGSAHANGARFGFTFEGGYSYVADTRISADGQRMTGHFHAVGDLSWPTAWLRVADDQPWLTRDPARVDEPWTGGYDLWLEEADAEAREYDAMTTYRLNYTEEGIASSLGSFWQSELARVDDNKIEVGPVSITAPELAVAMTLEGDGAELSRLHATTGSGHRYVFRASRQ